MISKLCIFEGMGRKKNLLPPVKFGITISTQMGKYIDDLVTVGLHGKTPPEVVCQLIGRQVEVFLKDGLLKKLE